MIRIVRIILLLLFICNFSKAQIIAGDELDLEQIDFNTPRDYEIGGVVIKGADNYDKNVLQNIAGLTPGETITIPGNKISEAIDNLWKQGLFADIKITANKLIGNKVFLTIYLEERPRLSRFAIKGVKKGEADDIREKIKLIKGKVVTDNLLVSTQRIILDHFINKGYLDCKVNIDQKTDTLLKNKSEVVLTININKNKKVKINDIIFWGNHHISSAKLRRALKDTKTKRWYRIFNQSKFIEENYTTEKNKIIALYNDQGFRDAKIEWDTVYRYDHHSLNIEIKVDEGKRYYFRNIYWLGNSKHSTQELSSILGIKKGDVYNQSLLDRKLNMTEDGRDISSLYMDDGYLFFQVQPVEVLVENDSIDIEIRIYEGKQAVINRVTVSGNTKTNDYVILREIRTKPGQLFSRADIIRTQRELAQLRYFDPQKLGVNPTPNPTNGTVDIEYTVEETPSDQVQLSAGWGQNRLVGTLGLTFNNFSTKNFFKRSSWAPLPSGDGQTLNIQAQSTGLFYQGYNISFVEPWLGGKKPQSLNISAYYSVQNPYGLKKGDSRRQVLQIIGTSVGLGKRLKRPDDYFTLFQNLSFERYILQNYTSAFSFANGFSNNLNYQLNLSRNSVDAPIYPKSGSLFTFSVQATPPYSIIRNAINKTTLNYSDLPDQEKFKWVEYHKWKFTAQVYTRIFQNLVLNTKAGFGFLGYYNKTIGQSPFERFVLGGSGLTGFVLGGREIIALRGYRDNSLSSQFGDPFIGKFTAELRYPLSLNPQATIFLLTFAEAGKTWQNIKNYNPFNMYRSAGAGIRLFLPMFGMLGLDYGFNFDTSNSNPDLLKGQFHFTIGANIGDL
jgi:outer membrane protein insertion porin family